MATVHGAPHLHQRHGTGFERMTTPDDQDRGCDKLDHPTCEGMADLPAPITEADEDN